MHTRCAGGPWLPSGPTIHPVPQGSQDVLGTIGKQNKTLPSWTLQPNRGSLKKIRGNVGRAGFLQLRWSGMASEIRPATKNLSKGAGHVTSGGRAFSAEGTARGRWLSRKPCLWSCLHEHQGPMTVGVGPSFLGQHSLAASTSACATRTLLSGLKAEGRTELGKKYPGFLKFVFK